MSYISINSEQPGSLPRRPANDVATVDLRPAKAAPSSGAVRAQAEEPVPQAQITETTRTQVEEAAKAVNEFLKPINNMLQFQVDEDTGKTVVKVIDLATKDVIRQFPSEEMLTIAKAIDKMKGLLIQQKA